MKGGEGKREGGRREGKRKGKRGEGLLLQW